MAKSNGDSRLNIATMTFERKNLLFDRRFFLLELSTRAPEFINPTGEIAGWVLPALPG